MECAECLNQYVRSDSGTRGYADVLVIGRSLD